MKTPKLVLIGTLAVLISGCPARDGVDAAADDGNAVPPGSEAEAVAGQSETVPLHEYAASGVDGEVQVVRAADEIEFTVLVREARPRANLPVRLHSGSCDEMGLAFAELESISTDDQGQGQSEDRLRLDEHSELGEPAALAVHVQDEEALPIACANL